jgi:hypothetical protein
MAFDPTEVRDSHGRWARSSSGEVSTELDQRVLDVSGDEWNRKTAARLEQEYALVRPELDKIAQKAENQEAEVVGAPGSWESMSTAGQTEAEEKYLSDNYDSVYESEVNNWYESGDALNDAKYNLASNDDFVADFMADFLSDRDDDAEHIPYTAQQLTDALEVKPGEDGSDPEIKFNLDALSKPDNLNPDFHPDQMPLPGIDAPNPKPSDSFTATIENDLRAAFIEAFNQKAEKLASNESAPDYLSDTAHESVQEQWNNMSDDEKFEWTKNNTELTSSDDEDNAVATTVQIPNKFDPLNLTSGEDYRNTQALAKYMSDERAAQIIAQRTDAGVIGKGGWKPRSAFLGSDADYEKLYGPGGVGAKKDDAWIERMRGLVQSVDTALWSGWKGSSTNEAGKLLQVAAAEELGGRLRERKPELPEDFPEQVIKAKETIANPDPNLSQEEAHNQAVWANKIIAQYEDAKAETSTKPKSAIEKSELVNGYVRLPELNVVRNGAASTTVNRDVANGWGGTQNYSPSGIDKKEVIASANKQYASIGGYEGVKAAIRAKWETTQYLLDRAGMPVLQLFRGISLPHTPSTAAPATGEYATPHSGVVTGYAVGKHPSDSGPIELEKVPVGTVLKISSGKTITKVSDTGNEPLVGTWKFDEPPREVNRVVLRAELPRTAVISVPAYGINVKSEQEVVVAGTAWKNWDAWSGRAPSFEDVPMGRAADTQNDPDALARHEQALNKQSEDEFAQLDKMLEETKNWKPKKTA